LCFDVGKFQQLASSFSRTKW